MTPTVATDRRFELAEGPVWDARRGLLWWVDIAAGTVHRGVLDGALIRPVDELRVDRTVGAVAVADDGSVLVAAERHLVVVGPDGSRTDGPRVIPDGVPRRCNDGAVDPAGRFVVGTLSLAGSVDTGPPGEVLVRVEFDGRVTRLDTDLALSNGLAWSADGRTMYSVDTLPGLVHRRPYDPASGTVGSREVHLEISDGLPDGIALDADDHLWVAIWGAGEVRRYAPDGSLAGRLAVPAPHTSSVAFAGDDLRTLVITTAAVELTPAQLATHPDSGRLFTVRTDVAGVPLAPWAGWTSPAGRPGAT